MYGFNVIIIYMLIKCIVSHSRLICAHNSLMNMSLNIKIGFNYLYFSILRTHKMEMLRKHTLHLDSILSVIMFFFFGYFYQIVQLSTSINRNHS